MASKLATLFMDRCKAFEAMPPSIIASLDEKARVLADQQSAQFRAADAAIVNTLRLSKDSPSVKVGKDTVQFKLTSDRLNFYAADVATGRPLVWSSRHGFQPSANIH